MSEINDKSTVKKQYENSDNLSTRISIHDKYSVNKMGFGNWIFSNYEIEDGMKVLEIGCGTGDMWKGNGGVIKKCAKLVLTDFSEKMIETTQANIGRHDNVSYQVVDIQSIPFADHYFDVVIANMMLYHVPDLDKGLSEVRRVLKQGGKFYCATYGEHGIVEYLSKLLSVYGVEDHVNKNFTLQNGKELLEAKFADVQRLEYVDSLEVTNIDDMVDYIYSLSGMTTLSSIKRESVKTVLEQNMENGVLSVPKEYGMFICGNARNNS